MGKSIDRNNIDQVLSNYIQQMRSSLEDESETAQAIDQNKPWVLIAKSAFKEKLEGFAEMLYIGDRLKIHAAKAAKKKVGA